MSKTHSIVFKAPQAYPSPEQCGICGAYVAVPHNPTGFYLEGESKPICDSCAQQQEPDLWRIVNFYRRGCAVCAKGSPHDGGGVIWNDHSWLCDTCYADIGRRYQARRKATKWQRRMDELNKGAK